MATKKDLSTFSFPSIAKSEPLKKGGLMQIDHVDLVEFDKVDDKETPDLVKSILRVLNGPKDSVERLAFERNPRTTNVQGGVYRPKQRLIPDAMLKRIAIQDDLVAAIVNARANHIASFGRPRQKRFDNGFVIEPRPGVVDKLSPEGKIELDQRIERSVNLLSNCGHTEGLKRKEQMSFVEWLMVSAKNAVTVGRIAADITWSDDPNNGGKKFHRFRAVDAGTIYHAADYKTSTQSLREAAIQQLAQLRNKKIVEQKTGQDDQDYSWVQVIDGTAQQVFTDDELLCHNFYPVNDVELDGYPVTPIDTMLSAVTTHINITSHNKLYFQTGRASRGMLVIRSDDVDETAVARVKQQFNASINNVNNSWRMPVFAVGSQDAIEWQPIDNSSRDAEFQYLTDQNARVILSAFQMSPEELPGWSYLSRGTNSQALSESNNEFRLTAARDVGIRPLIAQFEDFINSSIFPLLDPGLAKICNVRLTGLDAETPEKESVRLQQDMPVHMTFDQVLEKVEKKPIGRAMGGEFPLNPQFQSVIDKYLSVGQILKYFFGIEGADKDPELAYKRDPFWFQFQQLKQAAQQIAQGPQAPQQSGPKPASQQSQKEGVSDTDQPSTEGSKTEQPEGEDLARSIDQAIGLLTKSEQQLPPSRRRLLEHQRATLAHAIDGMEEEMKAATKAITEVAAKNIKRKA